jgi:hypothetical protein
VWYQRAIVCQKLKKGPLALTAADKCTQIAPNCAEGWALKVLSSFRVQLLKDFSNQKTEAVKIESHFSFV